VIRQPAERLTRRKEGKEKEINTNTNTNTNNKPKHASTAFATIATVVLRFTIANR
jgi:hypothetical protein